MAGHDQAFIYGSESQPLRAQRILCSKAALVVIVETTQGRYVELDADDMTHAWNLAYAWLVNFGHKSVAIWKVDATGKLASHPEHILDWRDFEFPSEEEIMSLRVVPAKA